MSKYSSIEASSFDELCAVDDFDVLVCKTSIEDPLGIQTRLYDPEKYPEVPWQDFFVWLQQDDWNSLLGRSRFARDVSRCSVAGRWQAPSETDNPYALLREIFATTSAGAQLVLSVTPSSPSNLTFVTNILACARLYAITWSDERELGHYDYMLDRQQFVVLDSDDPLEMESYLYWFGQAEIADGRLSYNWRHPFPVSKSFGTIESQWAGRERKKLEAVVWHRRYALGKDIGDPGKPPPSVEVYPGLWQKAFVNEALDDGTDFRTLAWLPGNQIVAFAQRIGNGAIIVAPVELQEAVANFVPARDCWTSLSAMVAHTASDDGSLELQPTVKRNVTVSSSDDIWIRFPSVRTLQIKFGKDEGWICLSTMDRNGLHLVQNWKATDMFRLLFRAYREAPESFNASDIGASDRSRITQASKLKNKIEDVLKRKSIGISVSWQGVALVKKRGDQYTANFQAVKDVGTLADEETMDREIADWRDEK